MFYATNISIKKSIKNSIKIIMIIQNNDYLLKFS